VRDEDDLSDLEGIEHARNILALIELRVACVGMRREPHPAQIRDDDSVSAHQLRSDRLPHVACVAKAVKQHDCRTGAADPDIKAGAVGFDHLRMNAIGKGKDLPYCRRREKERPRNNRRDSMHGTPR